MRGGSGSSGSGGRNRSGEDDNGDELDFRKHRAAMHDSHHVIRMLFRDEQDVSILEILVCVEGAQHLIPADHAFKDTLDVFCEAVLAVRPTDTYSSNRCSVQYSPQAAHCDIMSAHANRLARKKLLYSHHSTKRTSTWNVQQHGDPQWTKDFVFRFPVRRDLRHFTVDIMFRVFDHDRLLDKEVLIGECIVLVPVSLSLHDNVEPASDTDEMASDQRHILCTLLDRSWQLTNSGGSNAGSIKTSISVMYVGDVNAHPTDSTSSWWRNIKWRDNKCQS